MDIDKSYLLFSMIIAGCALLSPAVVAIVQNHYQWKMHKLEIEERKANHVDDVIDGYFRAAGVCSKTLNQVSLANFGEYSSLIYFYLPSEYHSDITEINKAAKLHSNYELVAEPLEKLALKYAEQRKGSK